MCACVRTVHVIEFYWKFDFTYQIEMVAGAGGEPLRMIGRSGTIQLVTSSDVSPRPEKRGQWSRWSDGRVVDCKFNFVMFFLTTQQCAILLKSILRGCCRYVTVR